jgi:hypothetical protein
MVRVFGNSFFISLKSRAGVSCAGAEIELEDCAHIPIVRFQWVIICKYFATAGAGRRAGNLAFAAPWQKRKRGVSLGADCGVVHAAEKGPWIRGVRVLAFAGAEARR